MWRSRYGTVYSAMPVHRSQELRDVSSSVLNPTIGFEHWRCEKRAAAWKCRTTVVQMYREMKHLHQPTYLCVY